jgi:uncharacterized membrane protein
MGQQKKTVKNKSTSRPTSTKITKEFFEVKPEEAKEVYKIYVDDIVLMKTVQQIQSDISFLLISKYKIPQIVGESAAARIYENFSSGVFQETLIDDIVSSSLNFEFDYVQPKIRITAEDYKKYTELIQTDPEITLQAKKLLFAFVVYYRYNYHPKGWIKYDKKDKKNIFFLAGAQTLSTSQQEQLTTYLHTHYELNMQVKGSNNPIPCYNLPWLQDQPLAGSTDNPFLTLGNLTSEDLTKIVEKIK